MNKIPVLILIILLTGCVTYYHPKTALEDGVYYAQDDPAYVVYHEGYPGTVYYPWLSLDYFYLGFYPYPGYAYYYGFPHGFGYGYSPWDYPYHYFGYYAPIHAVHNHYPHFPSWRPYNGYCSHYRVCGRLNDMEDLARGPNRHAGNNNKRRRNRDADETDEDILPAQSPASRRLSGSIGGLPLSHYVSTPPSGYAGNRGMVIRRNDATKIGKSRTQPDQSAGPFNATAVTAPSPGSSPAPSARAPGVSPRSGRRSASGIKARSHRAPRNSSSTPRKNRD